MLVIEMSCWRSSYNSQKFGYFEFENLISGFCFYLSDKFNLISDLHVKRAVICFGIALTK